MSIKAYIFEKLEKYHNVVDSYVQMQIYLNIREDFQYSPARVGPGTELCDDALLTENMSSPLRLRHLRVPPAVSEDLLECLSGIV